MGFKLKKVLKGVEKIGKTWGDLMVGAGSTRLGKKLRKKAGLTGKRLARLRGGSVNSAGSLNISNSSGIYGPTGSIVGKF